MTEREYIDTTNLARSRAAAMLLSGVLPMTKKEKKLVKEAHEAIQALEDHWAAVVATTE